MNFSRYTNWAGGRPGCAPGCAPNFAVLLKAPTMQWSPTNKGLDFPYICQSNCAVGYVWRIAARKCVKAFRGSLSKASYGKAEVECAKDNARLYSVSRCDQFSGIQDDLFSKFPFTTETLLIFHFDFQH